MAPIHVRRRDGRLVAFEGLGQGDGLVLAQDLGERLLAVEAAFLELAVQPLVSRAGPAVIPTDILSRLGIDAGALAPAVVRLFLPSPR